MFRAVERERRGIVRVSGVADEASSGMRVEANHEKECEVVGVPEGLKALVADLVVRSCVHEDHDEQHEMASNAAGLRVMNVKGSLRTNLCRDASDTETSEELSRHTGAFHVEEVHVMRSGVNHSPECHRIRDLSVEPDVLVRGEEPGEPGTNDTDNVTQHRHQNHPTIEGQYETGTTRDPYGPLEAVQSS